MQQNEAKHAPNDGAAAEWARKANRGEGPHDQSQKVGRQRTSPPATVPAEV